MHVTCLTYHGCMLCVYVCVDVYSALPPGDQMQTRAAGDSLLSELPQLVHPLLYFRPLPPLPSVWSVFLIVIYS